MNILVTGAGGYIGQGITKTLLDRGNNVTAAGRHLDRVDDRAVKIEGDIFDAADPYKMYNTPDVVLHLAWRNGFIHNAQSHIDDLPKHYGFLQKFMVGPACRIAVMGTMHEIGQKEGAVDAETPCEPNCLYGIAKNALRAAVLLEAESTHTPVQWMRGYYIVGKSTIGNSIFSKIVIAEQMGQKEFPFTSGTNIYDFIDYDDFCKQIVAVAEQQEITGIINICSGVPERLADRIERFIKDNGYSLRLKYGSYPERKYDSKAIWGDNKIINTIIKNTELDMRFNNHK